MHDQQSTKRPVDTEASEPVAKKVCTGSNGHSCGSEAHKIGDVDSKQAMEFMENRWKEDIEKNLCDYIAIPNQSPMFDPECLTNGYQDQAMDLIVNWVKKQNVEGLNLKVYVEPNRTPLLFIEIEATDKKTQDTTLMYGHMDKQPPLAELWDEGLGPWKPVIRGDKLYGRGGADDGYSVFAAISAIQVRVFIHVERGTKSASACYSCRNPFAL